MFAPSMRLPLASSMELMAFSMSGTSKTWIWPIMTGSVLLVRMPSPSLMSLAMLLAAATTEGSSMAMGTM